MLKYTCLVLLACLNLAVGFDKSISLKEYSQCKSEAIVEPGQKHNWSYMKSQKYVFLDSLHYGKKPDEIKVKFYFQGGSHFGIALLPEAREPGKDELVFNTQISTKPNLGNSFSAIFLNTAETKICDSIIFSNPMDDVYFTELELVINKKYGFLAVFLPNFGTKPFLKCYEPDLMSKVKYLGITERQEQTVRYIFDCPV